MGWPHWSRSSCSRALSFWDWSTRPEKEIFPGTSPSASTRETANDGDGSHIKTGKPGRRADFTRLCRRLSELGPTKFTLVSSVRHRLLRNRTHADRRPALRLGSAGHDSASHPAPSRPHGHRRYHHAQDGLKGAHPVGTD